MIYLPLLILLPVASLPPREALPLPPPPPGTALVQPQQTDPKALPLPPPPAGLKLLLPVEKRALVQTGLPAEPEPDADAAGPEDVPDESEMEALRALEEATLSAEALGADDAQTVALLQTLRTFGASHPLRLRLEDALGDGDHRERALVEVPPVRDVMAFDVSAGAGPLRHPGGDAAAGGPVHPVLPGPGAQVVPQVDVALHALPAGDAAHPRGARAAAGHGVPGDDRERLLRPRLLVGARRRALAVHLQHGQAVRAASRTSGWTSGSDPIKATHAAARYLQASCTRSSATGTWRGPATTPAAARVRRMVERHGTTRLLGARPRAEGCAKETKHYVPKLIAAALVAKHPERLRLLRGRVRLPSRRWSSTR